MTGKVRGARPGGDLRSLLNSSGRPPTAVDVDGTRDDPPTTELEPEPQASTATQSDVDAVDPVDDSPDDRPVSADPGNIASQQASNTARGGATRARGGAARRSASTTVAGGAALVGAFQDAQLTPETDLSASTFRLPKYLLRVLDIVSATTRRSKQDIIADALRGHLDPDMVAAARARAAAALGSE